MHHRIQPVLLAAIVGVAASLTAQQASRPAGSLAERFKQLDRNGDEKLTRNEVADAATFAAADADKDGAVTR